MDTISLIKPYLKYLFMYGIGASLLVGYLVEKVRKSPASPALTNRLNNLVMLAYGVMVLVALAYLVYPNYIDHVEPTIAMLGLMLKEGAPLYPPIDAYSFHGLLYGPLLAEVQAIFQYLSNDPILNSKLPGILAFVAFSVLAIRSLTDIVGRAYLLLLLPFNLYLFWNRAESLFLLLAVFSWIASRHSSLRTFAWLGFLSGLMFSLKAHGLLYAAPFFLISLFRTPIHHVAYLKNIGTYIAGILMAGALCFSPSTISITQYAEYIRLASQHGISTGLLERNLFFMLFAVAPLLTLHWKNGLSQRERLLLVCTLIVEALAAIAGAKPGAGTHHLIPFVFVNACLLDHLKSKRTGNSDRYKYTFVLMAIYIVFLDLPQVIHNEYKNNNFSQQWEVRNELLELKQKYPDALMGFGSDAVEPYARTFYKVLLQSTSNQQTDAASFMDLSFSGIGDQPLTTVFEQCLHPTVFLPMGSEPFSIGNFYTGKPLFSDELRATFHKNYFPLKEEKSQFFQVYRCTSSTHSIIDKSSRSKEF